MKRNSTLTSVALRLCFVIAALCASATAFAGYYSGVTEDLVFNDTVKYTRETGTAADYHKYYIFTPETDGLLYIVCSTGIFSAYYDDTFDRDEVTLGDNVIQEEDGGFTNEANGISPNSHMNVTAGTTYYLSFNTSASFDAWYYATFYTSDDKPECIFINPAEDEVLEINDSKTYGQISMSFNRSVEMGTVSFYVAASKDDKDNVKISASGVSRRIENGLYVVDVRDLVYTWLSEGFAEEGDYIWMTIEDIYAVGDETCIYGEDGTFTAGWYVPVEPIGLVSAVWPETFYDYWEEGDESAIATLTFTGDLATYDEAPYQTAFARIQFGNMESEEDNSFYQEDLGSEKITIEGNVMKIDFSGKDRSRAAMTKDYDSSDCTQVSLAVRSVTDWRGAYAYSTSAGSVGSFSGSYVPYIDNSGKVYDPSQEEQKSTEIVTTPADGETIHDLYYISFYCEAGLTASWYSDPDTGVQLTEESILVLNEDGDIVATGVKDSFKEEGNYYTFSISEDITEETIYTIFIPQYFFYVGSGTDTYSDEIYISIEVDSSVEPNECSIEYEGWGELTGSTDTGISAIAVSAQNSNAYYNLAGQRVVSPTKGIYINNGKKIIIK